jgi:hypothetical protein
LHTPQRVSGSPASRTISTARRCPAVDGVLAVAARHTACRSPRTTGRQEDARINLDQEYEMAYWTERFGVSRNQLRSGVAKAGPMVKN